MNQEHYISTAKITMAGLWVLVAALILSAWAILIIDYDHRQIAYMLALTGCALSSFAAVQHISIFLTKVTQLIRVTSGLDRVPGPSGPSEGSGLRVMH